MRRFLVCSRWIWTVLPLAMMTKMDPSPQRHGRKVKVDVDGHIRKIGHGHGPGIWWKVQGVGPSECDTS